MAKVQGTDNPETLDGDDGVTGGADTIFGYGGDDQIFGLGGNDHLKGGGGADALYGGGGSDTANYGDATGSVTVSLLTNTGASNVAAGDTLSSIENLTGSSYGDILVGNNGINVVTGLEGGDTLIGHGGADSLNGNSGNDTLKGGGGADTLNGGSGIDTVSYSESGDGVYVSLIADLALSGDAQGDELNSIENLTGSDFADFLNGNNSANVLKGGDGDDTLRGYNGADILNGGNGIDTLKSGSGADTLNGGAGVDTADYFESTAGVFVSLSDDTASGGHAAGDELNGIENLTGSDFADILWGNNYVNVLKGGNGDDHLRGYGGADKLIGGDGVDTLFGLTGADTTNGGSGNDWHFVDNVADTVIEWSGGGTDRVLSSVDYTLGPVPVEILETATADGTDAIDLTGNGFDNEIRGNNGTNTLNGKDGNDTLIGNAGADTTNGGSGDDEHHVDNAADTVIEEAGGGSDHVLSSVDYTLGAAAQVEFLETNNADLTGAIDLTGNGFDNYIMGNHGDGTLNGGAGNDTIVGGHGVNTLNGGAGNDSLIGGFAEEPVIGTDSFLFDTTLNALTNFDEIVGFALNTDVIVLDNDIFAGISLGVLAAGRFHIGDAAAAATDRIIYKESTGAILYDADGTGPTAQVRFAYVEAGLALDNEDFLVVA